MSLVNKMLKDLEARQGDARSGRPIFQDLHTPQHNRRRLPVGLILLTVLLLAGGGYFAWQHWGAGILVPAQTAALAVAPVAVPAPDPVSHAGVVPEAAVPAATPTEAVAATSKTETTVPSPAVNTVAPAPLPASDKPRARPETKPAPPATEVVKAAPVQQPTRVSAPTAGNTTNITKTDRPYTPAELAANAYREAQQARAQGNPAEAERHLKALLAAQPRLTEARELLAAIQVENGRWPEAQATLEQGIVQVPTQAGFRFQLARLHLEHNNESNAVAVLERARADGIQDVELPAFLAALYQRSGRHEDAIKNYKEALATRPAEGKWWLGLGISLEAKPDAAAARDAYRRALDTGRLPANLTRYAEDRLKALAAR